MKTEVRTCVVLLCLLLAGVASAQEFRATLTGRVLDSSGGVVPNAVVQARNVATNELASVNTDNQGMYTIPFLRPGEYTVVVEATGFKKHTRDGLFLQVGQSAAVNITLEVGQVTETVNVTAEVPLLETSKADRGGVIDRERIHELPLNGRNPFLLGAMVAGVKFNGAAIWQRPFDNGAIAEWSINGSQTRGTEFLLDGTPNNGQAGGNNIAYVPPVDSVQEFKIQTNIYDAQYGKTNGGIINVSMKSGTNNFHGTAYEFARRKSWDANTFQNNAFGTPRPDHLLDQYGFQVEGPIYIPKLFNGRDKLFFMINYEGYREHWPQQDTLSVPSPEFLTGDFSRLADRNGNRISVYDPTTGRQVGNSWVRDPFPGNLIPQSRIQPVARNILAFMPKPNQASPAGQEYSQRNLFLADNVAVDKFYQLVFKFDANLGNRNRVFFRHGSNDRTEMRNSNGVNGPGECCQLPFQRINDHATFDWVSTISPTFIFNLRAGANRFIEKGFSRATEGFDMTKLGWSRDLVNQLPHGAWFGLYDFNDYISLGRYPSGNWTNAWAIHPTATWIRGPHSLKFGLDWRFTQYALRNTGDPFRLRAQRNFTQREFNIGDALSGNSIATFMIGGVTEHGDSRINLAPFPIFGHPYYAFYVHDDWKVTRKLTLNLGLRWDINQDARERYNRLNRGFDINAASPIASLIDRNRFPQFANIKGGLLFAGVGGVGTRAAETDWNNFQPRIGVAYQLFPKVVLRGGWGIAYLNPSNNDLLLQGFSQSTPLVASVDGQRTFRPDILSNPYPTGARQAPGASQGLNTFLGQRVQFYDPNFRTPYMHQFSFGFDFELPHNSVVEVSYVGNRTMDLESEREINEMPVESRRLCNVLEGGRASFCNEQIPNPFGGLEPFRGTGHFNPTISRGQLLRPYPQFGAILMRGLNTGQIWYNSLQIQHQTRMRGGVNILSSYALSKQVEQWGYTDHAAGVLQRGLYFIDTPHRITAAAVWQLPFGQGRKWGNTSHGLWSRVVTGWQITGFYQWQSGRPWDYPGNVIPIKDAKLPISEWNAHRVQGVRPCVGRVDSETGAIVMQAYSTAAGCAAGDFNFLINPQYAPRVTPLRSGQIRQHAAPNIDMSINKTTRITETTSIQFRAEAFNVTNTYFWGRNVFITDPNNSNFGAYFPRDATSQNRYPRQVQLAVKFLW